MLIAANWKMHGNRALAHGLAAGVAARAGSLPPEVQCVLCPPAPLLHTVAEALEGSAVALGGQDCHARPEGAFTGDVSAPMLREAGCRYVIVGHSERRQYHHETDADVRAKAAAALESGLIPIICVGEILEILERGQAEGVVERQLRHCVPENVNFRHFVLAYEPIWAIGTGRTAEAADIEAMHRHIHRVMGTGVTVLYGGSVKASNAADILAVPGVGGVLVGGASLRQDEFGVILDAAAGRG